MLQPIRWYDLLTRDHTVCRICFLERAEHGVRILTDPAIIAKRSSPRTRAAYIASLRAAFRRHLATEHPDWSERVRWVKD